MEQGDIISTKLFSLKPMGLDTELVESQTSYISRLADAHCVTVGTLIGKEIAPILGKDYLTKSTKNGGSRFYEHGIELNGLGKQANDFAKAISELTGINTISNLTFVTWHYALPTKEMFRQSKAWCPMCLENSKNNKLQIYEPLIWNFKAVKICGIHNIILKTKCPNCGREIPVLSRKSRNGFCSFCGCWLGSDDTNINEKVKIDELPWEYFIVANIGSLIKMGSELTVRPTDNSIYTFLKSVIDKAGGIEAFSRCLNVPISTVKPWLEGKHKPLLYTLLKICYHIGINITEVFSSNQLYTNLMPIGLYSEMNNKIADRRIERRDWLSVETTLKDIVNNKNATAPSAREVARILGCDKRLLYSHFPALCKMISENHTAYIQMMKRKRIEEGCKRVYEATVSLYNSGIYPSRRSVEKFLYPNYILREGAYQLAWKETLINLGLLKRQNN